MEKTKKRKIELSNNIYPIFFGLSSDLMFWIAINTLFLTTVKHLSAAQINSIGTIATGIGIVFQFFLIKIVRKIGNLKSVRLGTILLFLSATLNTFATTYIGLLIAEICYTLGLVFKNMDSVILIKNLNYLNKSEQYIKLQTKGSTIYSFVTLTIAIISGFLFNANPYLPMIMCMCISFINILLTYCIYEVPESNTQETNIEQNNDKIKFDKIMILLIILYGAFYSMIAAGQQNSKLFIQLNMQEFLELSQVAIYMSVFLALSRISRLISNLIFLKIYNKFRNKMIFILEIILVLSFILLLLGNFIGKNMLGIYIMVIGFLLYLFLRDPFDNFMKKILFDNSKDEVHDKIINYMSLSRKIFALMYGTIISTMLINLSYEYVITVLLILSTLLMVLIVKIYNLLKDYKKG